MNVKMPQFIERLPLQIKLTGVIFFACFGISIVGMLIYVSNNLYELRERIQNESQFIVNTVATYSAADLAFRDIDAAKLTLAGLEKMPQVLNAFLFDDENTLFAALRPQPAAPISTLPAASYLEFRDDFLHVIEPVRYQDKKYGSLYVLFSNAPLKQRIRSAWLTFAAMSGATLLLSLLLAMGLQRIVSKPIQDLARAAGRVSTENDFTIEVAPRTDDEIGDLARAFNLMLKRIHHREAERRAADEQVRQLNKELEQRVNARTAQLADANKELEAFSYSVSHDLRAPLRAIDGFAHALEEDYGQKLDSEGRDYLERVRSATQRMGVLIDDLLNLSRLSRAEMHTNTVDLSRVAREVADELLKANSSRRVEINIGDGVTVIGDSGLLRVVMQNLLGNAWKYTKHAPVARIEFGETVVDNVRCFYVRDNGAGFDMKYANKLFTPFQRLHTSEEFEGTGIGLATVARIIRRHSGRIWATAEIDKGAAFYFTLNEFSPYETSS